MGEVRTFEEIGAADVDAVGGKALNLALLARAGFPVPPGLCITTAVHRRLVGRSLRDDPELVEHICDAYRRLGRGAVAVRSSAADEDGRLASFAGQQDTILGVSGERAVLDAIDRCRASIASGRAIAYRKRQGLGGEGGAAMGVVVQQLVPAEVSGVAFTVDPLDLEGRRMLVEASWGFGEGVVSGRVTPHRFRIDRETGAIMERQVVGENLRWTVAADEQMSPEMHEKPCLNDAQLAALAAMCRSVESFYGAPRDIEWAWAEGQLWLLQARPITTISAVEREQVRREQIAELTRKAEPGGTVWSRYNLAEILSDPTPMTWAIVQRLVSGRGGMGAMYRDFGFTPDASLDHEGTYDLICGRTFCNLSRELRMQYGAIPFEHDFAALKRDPCRAAYPEPRLNPARGGWRFWLGLPWIMFLLARSARRLRREATAFPRRFREEVIPRFLSTLEAETSIDLTRVSKADLLQHLDRVIGLTLNDFARESLKPTVLAGAALAELEAILARAMEPERAHSAAAELIVGARPDPDADLAAAVFTLRDVHLTREEFLRSFGHRCKQEMELMQPRWNEEPEAVDALLSRSVGTLSANARTGADGKGAAWQRIAAEARLTARQRRLAEQKIESARSAIGLRETAKHYLMKGYAQIRRLLLELDHRYGLDGGIFFLTPDELPRLLAGEDFSTTIASRRRRRTANLSLDVPQVLFSDDLEAIGRPVAVAADQSTLQGTPLSAGCAEGLALVLEEPAAPPQDMTEPFVLVCPSTDPAWVPLFARACGLLMETGGILSHGAIVAREFGVPAIAGLPGIYRRLSTGQRLRVDGTTGRVTLLDAAASEHAS